MGKAIIIPAQKQANELQDTVEEMGIDIEELKENSSGSGDQNGGSYDDTALTERVTNLESAYDDLNDAKLDKTATAASATKLATAQPVQVNLASEEVVMFDGTTSLPAGVMGVLPVNHGGTGASTAADARTNLGLGNVDNTADADKSVKYATSASSATAAGKLISPVKFATNLASTGATSFDGSADVKVPVSGTLPLTNGGTGATTATAARTNLGLGTAATQAHTTSITSGSAALVTSGAVYNGLAGKASSSHTHSEYYSSSVSRTANTVLAAPNGSAGKASFRKLVAADLPSHTHSYLPLTGGTLSGTLWSTAAIVGGTFYPGGTNGNTYMTASNASSSSATLHLAGAGYLNLRSPGIQCRNYGDTAWAGISASSFTNQSSERYKENIELMTEERARRLLEVDVVTFDYKDGVVSDHQKDVPGVIVEWLLDLFPDVIHYRDIEDENGKVESLPDSADYIKFIPYIIKMEQIHEDSIDVLRTDYNRLIEENASLRAEIDALKADLAEIKALINS